MRLKTVLLLFSAIVVTVIVAMGVGIWHFLATDGNYRTQLSTDLSRLERQLNLPKDVTGVRWVYISEQDNFPIPSPPEKTLVGRMTISLDALNRFKAQGDWSEVGSQPELEVVMEPADKSRRLLENTSRMPSDSIIQGKTWMGIRLFVDADTGIIYFIVKKS